MDGLWASCLAVAWTTRVCEHHSIVPIAEEAFLSVRLFPETEAESGASSNLLYFEAGSAHTLSIFGVSERAYSLAGGFVSQAVEEVFHQLRCNGRGERSNGQNESWR
jgi:hypothetical protein